MKHPTRNQNEAGKRRAGESAQARIIVLALVSFAMGITVSALWFSRKARAESAPKMEAAVQIETDIQQQEAAPPKREYAPFAKRVEPPSRPLAASSAPPLAQSVDPAALEAVKRAIPNIEAASVETGARILRKAALAELQQAVQEFQARQKQVEQRLAKGDNFASEEQHKIVTKQLKELQLEQMEKIKQIAASSKAQIDAFQQLKEAAH